MTFWGRSRADHFCDHHLRLCNEIFNWWLDYVFLHFVANRSLGKQKYWMHGTRFRPVEKKTTAKPKKSTPIQQSNSIKRHQNRLPADRIYWLSDEIERCVGLQPIDSSQCGCAGLKKDRRRNLQFLILRSSIEIITGVSISTKPFNLLWSMFWNICFQFPFNDIIQWWLMCQCKKELRDRKLIGWKKKTSLKLS